MEYPPAIQIIGDTTLTIVCIYAVVKGVGELLQYIRISKASQSVEGEIVSFTEEKSNDGITYPAIVSYTTKQGEKIIATARTSNGLKPSIGKKVMIVYDPLCPTTFYFKRSVIPILAVLVIIAFGTGATISILHLCSLI